MEKDTNFHSVLIFFRWKPERLWCSFKNSFRNVKLRLQFRKLANWNTRGRQ